MIEAASSTSKVFVGIRVLEPIVSLLQAFSATGLAESGLIQWSDPADLHVTLKFIGAIPRTTVPILIDKLKAIRCPRFVVEISGADIFEDAEVLVVDIARSESLASLRAAVIDALPDRSVSPDSRDYRPHITVGRWSRSAHAQPRLFEPLKHQLEHYCEGISTKTFPVDEFILYETVSGHYRVVERFQLEDPDPRASVIPVPLHTSD